MHYAAPEQVSGAPISTAADIWALGVLLYELLTGLKPFSGDGRGKLEQDVLKGQPARPSQRKAGAITRISKSLASDLDTIVLKALKKKPAERYATVNALADDLDRWLQGEAVLAQPDSRWYRTRKFVGRYRLAVATATTLMLVVIGIATVAVIQGIKAREEAARLITLRAAEVLGISDRLGAIKAGMDGTVIVTDGEISEIKTQVLRAFIQSREVDLKNRQTRLYEKYRARPKAK